MSKCLGVPLDKAGRVLVEPDLSFQRGARLITGEVAWGRQEPNEGALRKH